MYTVPLSEAAMEPIHKIGAKAMQLARLTTLNILIPKGFVITSTALQHYMVDNGLYLNRNLGDYIVRFHAAEFPASVYESIITAFTDLQSEIQAQTKWSVAVRSSSSLEDLNDASFAGQYESFLHVTEIPHLFESIKQCWLSFFSPRILDYAQQINIASIQEACMAVLVQQMVQSEVAGVIFSINPVTGNPDEIVINASYGLGESIVAGMVTPDTYYVNKNNGFIKRELGVKDFKIVGGEQRTVHMETSLAEQRSFCLSDREIAQLVNQTILIEAFFGRPVDIEFAIESERIYILQARPVTT